MTDNFKKPVSLHVGETNFAVVRENNYYYADKTKNLYNVVKDEGQSFLSRPRRFGKSLLVSSLENILRGRRELFKGLWIDSSAYKWATYPVIRLNMIDASEDDPMEINSSLANIVDSAAEAEEIQIKPGTPYLMLGRLIEGVFKKSGGRERVAVLIDEYDAPITNLLEEPAKAEFARKCLAQFYRIFKTRDTMLGHIFLTGVSRFTKTLLSSSLNNLHDLTLDPNFSGVCGFTQGDVDELLELNQDRALNSLIQFEGMPKGSTRADLRHELERWYDGYSWDGKTTVYNPWSILSFFKTGLLEDYWIDSGAASFLKKVLAGGSGVTFAEKVEKQAPAMTATDNAIDDIKNIRPEVFMFQAGYLTIEENIPSNGGGLLRRLNFPNYVARKAMVPLVFGTGTPDNPAAAQALAAESITRLRSLDLKGFEKSFGQFLAQWPFGLHIPSETYYHAQFATAMMMAKVAFTTQPRATRGIIDPLFTEKDGSDFVVELNYLTEPIGPNDKNPPPPATPKKLSRSAKAWPPWPRRPWNRSPKNTR
jgi:hypothetical protein